MNISISYIPIVFGLHMLFKALKSFSFSKSCHYSYISSDIHVELSFMGLLKSIFGYLIMNRKKPITKQSQKEFIGLFGY